jgi:integrative and conjugative element protein (TIGR02256 family)
MPNLLVPSVMLHRAVLLRIRDLALESGDGRETGGVVLGHDHEPGSIEVTFAGDPGPKATRTGVSFSRDLSHAQALADTAFERDQSLWIGEWHTHLHGSPAPSEQDVTTYRALLADPELNFDRIVSLIVEPGADSRWAESTVWPWIATPGAMRLATLGVEHASPVATSKRTREGPRKAMTQ